MISPLCVFTADYHYPPVDSGLLRRSCARLDIDLQFYGSGKTWPGYGIGKLVGPLEFLKTRTEPFCLYTDSQDSFLVRDTQAIIEAYARCGSPQVLLSAEKNCYPERDWAGEYPVSSSPWRYICAGGWMGTRKCLIAALEEVADGDVFRRDSFCDQRCWTDWYLRHPNGKLRASLDTNCEVFQSLFWEDEMTDDGQNKKTFTRPCVFHFNGRTHGEHEWYRRITSDAV